MKGEKYICLDFENCQLVYKYHLSITTVLAWAVFINRFDSIRIYLPHHMVMSCSRAY